MPAPPGSRVIRDSNGGSPSRSAIALHIKTPRGINIWELPLLTSSEACSLQLTRNNEQGNTAAPDTYRRWLHRAIAHVRTLLPLCDPLGLQVTIDLHTLPGGRAPSFGREHRICADTAWQRVFREVWCGIASMLVHEPAIRAYDLANEPVEGALPAGGYGLEYTCSCNDCRHPQHRHDP